MEKLAEFVAAHGNDDTTRLILDRAKWADIDMDMAVSCIESRRKLKGKVQEWADEPRLIFPLKLSAEQCSSSATGRYKSELAERISRIDGTSGPLRIADLTGGLGVDSWFFSKKASEVLYCEMLKPLCDAADHNFAVLGADNIRIRNNAIVPSSVQSSDAPCPENGATPEELLKEFHPDIAYMDPARRGEGGRKVFLIEECTPDVLTLKDEIFRHTRHILVKLSPMADITMVCGRLGRVCREVHIVAAGGECKELLIWMDREWDGEYGITSAEIRNDGSMGTFTFSPSEEKTAQPCIAAPETVTEDGTGGASHIYIFEPGKALMKAGAFSIISERFGIGKLGKSTHYYMVSAETMEREGKNLMRLGRLFRIIRCEPLDKRSIREAGKKYPNADVTARNIPMDTDTLRRKCGIGASGKSAPATSAGIHIFGLRSDTRGNLLFITGRQWD